MLFELLAVCLMALSPQEKEEGVTSVSQTTRQEFFTLGACEDKRDKLEVDKSAQDCFVICKKLKNQKRKEVFYVDKDRKN